MIGTRTPKLRIESVKGSSHARDLESAAGRYGRPTVRVKGRTHPHTLRRPSETLTSSPRVADTGRTWKEGVYVPSLPDRASLEYLKKLAKERLVALRAEESGDQARGRSTGARSRVRVPELASASRPSGPPARAEASPNSSARVRPETSACARTPERRCRPRPRTRLAGARRAAPGVRHPDSVRLLIEHGADPNVRDVGDNARRCTWRPRMGASTVSGCCSMPARTCTAAATFTTAT